MLVERWDDRRVAIMVHIRLRHAAVLVAFLGAGLVGCSSGDEGGTPSGVVGASVSSVASATSTPPPAVPGTQASDTAAPPVGSAASKASANNASIAELTAAFQAAGISSAARWAAEVDEYRPYATTDTNLAKLRQNLAKYNPGPGVVDAIVGALSLP